MVDRGVVPQQVPDEHVRNAGQGGPTFHVRLGECRRQSLEREWAGNQPVFIDAVAIVIVDEAEAGRLTKYKGDRQRQQTANG